MGEAKRIGASLRKEGHNMGRPSGISKRPGESRAVGGKGG